MSHLVYGSCNIHLQNALALYGLSQFMVALVKEYLMDPDLSDEENAANLLALEQFWLNWLFDFPIKLLPTAGSSLGLRHTDETKAKISASLTGNFAGVNNPCWGRTGELNPLYGVLPPNAKSISIYTLDGVLLQSFSSQFAAASWLNVSVTTVRKYAQSVPFGSNLSSNVGKPRFGRLVVGMVVLTPFVLGVVIGLLLSDGHLQQRQPTWNARLGFVQAGVPHFGVQFFTRSLPCFTELYLLFNIGGIKAIPANIYFLLCEVALAHWIMGDAYRLSAGLALCTDSFSISDVVRLMNVLMIRHQLE
ncbi:homing endonuclease, partial [Jimgerdemannia flammicorona]